MTTFDAPEHGGESPNVPPTFSTPGSLNLRALRKAIDKRALEMDGDAQRAAWRLSNGLEGAERLAKRGKPLSAVERKMLLDDVETLQTLLGPSVPIGFARNCIARRDAP